MKLLVIISTLLLFNNIALATDNFYVTGAFGYGYISGSSYYERANDYAYTINSNIGYNFNRYFALDTGLTFIPSNNSIPNYFITDIAAKASIALGDFASAYIHLGPGYVTSYTNSSMGLFTGIGAAFKVSQNISINIENYGIIFAGDLNVINTLTLGAIYDF